MSEHSAESDAPCWCSAGIGLGRIEHAPGTPCPVREHWLEVEDSETPTALGAAVQYARAFVALYKGIDGVVDEMSARDFRLTQENWALYLQAQAFLASVTSPGSTSGGGSK